MSRLFVSWAMLAGLTLLGLLAIGVVLVAVLVKGRARWWVLGSTGALVLLIVLVGLFYAGLRMESRLERMPRPRGMASRAPREPAPPDRPVPVELHESRRVPAVRSDDRTPPRDPLPFLADVYPSLVQAARALAAALADSLETVAPDGADLPRVEVRGQVSAQILEGAAEGLRSRALASGIEVRPGTPPASGSSRDVVCTVEADGGKSGRVQMTLRGPKGRISRSVRFVDKSWAANPGSFTPAPDQHFIFAASAEPCASPNEAERAAMEDAVRQLLPRVRNAIRRQWGARTAALPDEAQLRQLVWAELETGGPIVDRFAQRFPRPYGDVFRRSVLVDASPPRINALALRIGRQARGERDARTGRWLRGTVSVAGLAGLILVVYLLLNAATKGYYAWALRLGAAALVVTGTVLVLATL